MAQHWTAEKLDDTAVVVQPMSPEDESDVYKKLLRCRIQVSIYYPFFGYLIMNLQLKCDYSIDTAATDGQNFYYNPYYIKALSEPERSWIMIHECMHAALQHLWRRGMRNPQKWNYAADYCIHSLMMQYLDDNPTTARRRAALKMPRNCLYNSKFDDLSTEQIYEKLKDDFMQNPSFGAAGGSVGSSQSKGNQGDSSSDNNNDGGNGGGTPLDDHSKWNTPQAQKDSSIKQGQWQSKLVAAAMAANQKQQGKLPGLLKRIIERIISPQKNWKLLLNEWLSMEVNDWTFERPDSRYNEEEFGDIKMPGFFEEQEIIKNIAVGFDTSGSMSQSDIESVYSEIVGACEQFKNHLSGHVAFWDYESTELYPFEDAKNLLSLSQQAQGGGGTDPICFINKAFEQLGEDEITGFIICTDGYFCFPKEEVFKHKNILWLICNEDESVKPPYGIVARIKPSR